jgi:hypothetical protein
MPKFKRRKALARYENFAQTVVDTVVDHQYAKTIERTAEAPVGVGAMQHPYLEWCGDSEFGVDGQGNCMDDWLKIQQALACVYGHVFVVLDRESPTPAMVPMRGKRRPRTAADQGRPVLRTYTPLDVPDWLAPRNRLTAIKTVEAIERTSLLDPTNLYTNILAARDLQPSDMPEVEFRIWTDQGWEVYDKDGTVKSQGLHGIGELPVVVLYSRRRVRIPVVGRSLLRDPRLYRDHFNLVSELREITRGQTFSMLHIMLGEGEDVGTAKARLGEYASTETVLFTRGGAEYIAPPDGPAVQIAAQISDLERKVFRMIGLPWDADSAQPETADSRRIKASDLDRLLASQSDEAERTEYQIARLWMKAMYGPDQGNAILQASRLKINHPDEFNVQQVAETIEDTMQALQLGLGPSASARLRKQTVPILMRNLPEEDRQKIDAEIDEYSEFEFNNKVQLDMSMVQPPPPADVSTEGADVPPDDEPTEQPGDAPDGGTQ